MRRSPRRTRTRHNSTVTALTLEQLEARDVPATYAQGDLLPLGVGATDPDNFRFVNLKPMDAGDVINFTDNGFTAGSTGRTGEGYLSYTVPVGGHPVGTVLTWTTALTNAGTGWTSPSPSQFSFSLSGDQLFVFTGTAANTEWAAQTGITLICGVNFGKDLNTTSSSNNTVRPTALDTAFVNLPTGSNVNSYYSGNGLAATSVFIGGTRTAITTDLTTTAKWFGAGTVPPFTYPTATTLIITASPANQTVTAGGDATFTAAASGNAAATVQWEESTNGGTSYAPLSNTSVYSGVTTGILTITGTTTGLNGNLYRAVFTNSAGSAATGAATLTVNAGSTAPTIATQPTDRTVTAGGNTSFSAAATGSPTPSVKWQVKVPGGNFTDLTNGGVYGGVTTDTLTVTGATVAMSGNHYRAVYTNSAGSETTNEASLTVNSAAITVTPATLPDPALSIPYTQSVGASGGSGTYTYAISAGTPPTGLTLSAAGILSGTPTASGTFNFTVLATDAFGSTGTLAYTLVVPLVVGPANLPDGTRGIPYSQSITATGGTAPYSFAVTAGALPSGLTLDTNTGVISGTPDTANTVNFTVTVTNGAGRSGSRAYSVVIAPSASVSSVVRAGGPNTNAMSVSWTVTFSQAVSGLTAANFTLSDVATSLSGEGIASVTAVGGAPATQWIVAANTGTGEGTLRLDVTSPAGASPTLIGLPTSITTADIVIDRTAPTVVIGAPSVPLTAVGPVTVMVTYTGADDITLAPGDVTLNATGDVTATVTVSPTGNPRAITLSGITGTGTLGISLAANTASDLAGNFTPAAGPSAIFQVDNSLPTVSSVVRVGAASVTNAAQVQYTVTFNEPVVLGATPFAVTTTGTLSGVSVMNIGGGPTVYTVTVSTGSGDGTIRLDVPAGAGVKDLADNQLATAFTTGEVFTIDRTAPAVVIGPPSVAVTAGGPVSFLVTYTDANLSTFTLVPGQITLNRTGTANATVEVTGSGNTRTVTLTAVTGNGTLGISLPAGTAEDAAGNLATAAGPSGTVTADNSAPTVLSASRVGSAITNASGVQFSVTFNEDVFGVTTDHFAPASTTLTGLSVTNVIGGPRVFLVDVATGSGDGQLRLDIPASAAITDTAGNQLAASFSSGEPYTIDRTTPTVTISPPSEALTRGGPVSFTITYADANGVTPSLMPADISLNSTGSATAVIAVSGGGNTRTVTLSDITGNGTLGIGIASGTALDGANNAAPAVGPSADFTVDNTAPFVTAVVRAGVNPTNAASAFYTVSFNEDVALPAVGAFTLTTTGTLSGTSVSGVTAVDPRTYTVTVATGSGDGTLRLNVPASGAILDSAGNPLALTFLSGEAYTVLKSAPAVATTSPTNGSVIGPIGFGDVIHGTAADALGGVVSLVSVSIHRSSDGTFWTGSAWAGSGSLVATVTGPTWSVPFPAVAQTTGVTYTITSTATDAAENVNTATAVAYQWDASPAVATVALGNSVFGPNTWAGTVGGAATDTGPAGVAVVDVVVTRSTDGFTYDASTQSWAAGVSTNAVSPAAGAWSLSLPVAQLSHGVSYTVSAAAVDAVGNAQSNGASALFTFDAVAPSSTVTAPGTTFVGPSGWPASDQLAGTVSDSGAGGVATVRLSITRSSDGFFWNGTAWQPAVVAVDTAVTGGSWAYSLAATALADGLIYTVTSTTTDGAGNVQAIPGNRSFTWDAAAPSQVITAPVAGSFAGPLTFTSYAGTASDAGAAASGVAAVDLSLARSSDGFFWNGSAFISGPTTFPAALAGGIWTYSFDTADLADGVTYTLSAAARDLVGNVAAPATASFTFDAAGPTGTITAPMGGSTLSASTWTDLAGTAADGGAGVQLVEYRVLTAGGLVWNGATFAATGNWFAASGTTNWTAAFPFSSFPAGGDYRVEARATDLVGNVGPVVTADFTVTVSSVVGIAPQSPSVSVSNTTSPVTWRVTFSDPVSGVTAANFALVGSFATGSAITGVTPAGGSDWDVSATIPAAGTGTLGLNYISNVNITPAASAATVVGAVYTLDRVAPTVAITNDAPAAVIRVNQPVHYVVTFGDDTGIGTAGLTSADVINAVSSGAAFAIDNFTQTGPNGFEFDVTLTGEGDFRLRLAAPAVADTAGNTLSVPVTDTTTLTADGTAPTVASVVPVGTSPTQAATVNYIVTFSEAVSGIDAGDFTLTTTGGIVPGTISVNATSGTTFTVTVDTGSGDGTIRLDVLDSGSVRDAAGNPLAAGFTSADAFTIDRAAPTVAITLDAGQPSLTSTQPVLFEVTFSEPVSGFVPAGVQLVGTAGGLGSASKQVTNPSGDDRTFLVAVSGLTADGTLTISVTPGAASDAAGNALAVGATSPVATLDQTAPFVQSITRGSASPTNAATVSYTVTFSEAVDGVGSADFALVTAGVSGASITSVGGGGAVWTVVVGTGGGDGTLRLDLRSDATATDAAGNPLVAGAFSGEVFDVDRTAPSATIATPIPALRNTPVGSVAVTFTETVTGLDVADFTLTRDGLPLDLSAAQLTGGGTTYSLGNLAGLTATGGVYVLTLAAGVSGVTDSAGNAFVADAGTTFTVDVAAPTVTITPTVTGPTNAVAVAFTVEFSEPVGGVDTNPAGGFDFFAVTGSAPGAAIVSVVPEPGGVYTVTVGTGSGAGTIGLTFGANTVVTDAAGNAVSGPPAASTFTTVDHVRPTVTITEGDADGVVAVNAVVTFTVDVIDSNGVAGTLTASDFENAGTAGISVGSVTRTTVAGGLRFVVPVTPTTGGTLHLRLKAGAGVADGAGNDPDLPVIAARTLIVDADAPTVTVSRASGQAAVTNTQPIQFAVVFSEPVVGFDSGGVRLAGPGTAGAGIAVSGDGQFFVVTVSGLTADGAVTLTVPAAAVADAAGNENVASSGGDNTVTLDTAPPAVGLPALDPASDTGEADGLTADATPTFAGTAEPGVTVELFEGATRLGSATAGAAGWTITSSTLTDGTHVLFARATDAAGNVADSGSVVIRIDTSRPTVSITRGPGQPDAVIGDDGGVSVTFTVTTSEPVVSLDPSAIVVVGSAGGSVTAVTGGGSTFLVTVGGIDRSGSVSLAVADGAGGDAAGNPTVAAPGGESVVVTFPVLPALPVGQNSTGIYATVAGTSVTVFNADGSVRGTLAPFTRDESPFEVRVAVADVTGDGVPDVVAGTAAGAPATVRVLDGVTGSTVYSLGVFEGFRGGVFVAAGDLNGDGKSEIIVTPDQNGGPRVLVFDGATGGQLASFLGIQDDNFRGGARVAVGDINADGTPDLLVAAGFGGGPRLAGFDGTTVVAGKEPKKLFNDFFLFAPDLRDGVYVTVGDVDGDGYGDVIGGAGPGGAPRVLALSGYDLVTTGSLTPLASFFAGPSTLRGGVRLVAKDFDGDAMAELVTGSGDTSAVFVYGNAALNSTSPQPDDGLDMLPGLLPGVHVG